MARITFIKQCDCKGTASTNRVVLAQQIDGDECTIKATFHKGPVCDECNKPWRQEEDDA